MMNKSEKVFIFKSFVFWKIALVLVAILSVIIFPRFSDNFLGGGLHNYLKSPVFWGWANFDGEHYLSIALNGYQRLKIQFFPAFPFLMKIVSLPFGLNFKNLIWSGLLLSNLSFLLSLFVFWKIVRLDYSKKVAKYAVIALLLFPTSLYFGAVYTESLFLLTSLLTYYLYRKEKYFLSGLIGIATTLSRIYGVFVFAMIFVDMIENKYLFKKFYKEKMYIVGLGLLGIGGYMFFTWQNYSDPFAFYTLQTLVGQQHQKGIVLLPQVFYRYAKMFIFANHNLFSFQTLLLEVVTGIMFVFIPIYGYLKKIKWSYLTYILLGFLVPSAQGSFSSVPRYLVVIFPSFIVLGLFLSKTNKLTKTFYFLLSSLWLIINTALFIRGYWVA